MTGVVRGVGLALVMLLLFRLRPLTRSLFAGVIVGAALALVLHAAVTQPGVDLPGGGLVEGAAMPAGFAAGIYAVEAFTKRGRNPNAPA